MYFENTESTEVVVEKISISFSSGLWREIALELNCLSGLADRKFTFPRG